MILSICILKNLLIYQTHPYRRFWWPRDLRRGSAAVRFLGLWARIPMGAWMSVCLVSVVCCQVEVSATDRSLVQRSPTDCVFSCVMDCDQVPQ